MKISARKVRVTNLSAGAAMTRGAQRRIASISFMLALSSAILVFLPSWRAAHSSAPNSTAYGSAAPLQSTGGQAVKLGQALGTFPAGSVIPVVRCVGDFIGTGPDCPVAHLHAAGPGGITICGQGPFPDPNPEGCGYGPIQPFATDIGITVPLITLLEHQGTEVLDYTIKCVNNGPTDVDDVTITLMVMVDGVQTFNSTIEGPGPIKSGGFRFIVMHIDTGFKPDGNPHSMTAVFKAGNGVIYTCGRSQAPDLLDDPNLLNNTATKTGTIKPARVPPAFPNNFQLGSPLVPPRVPGTVFLTIPTFPTTGQAIPPLGTLLNPAGTPSQPIIYPLFGDGKGGFGPSTFITPSGGVPIRIDLTPFILKAPGDNHVDIGILNKSPGGISIFGSDGAGGFNLPPIITPFGVSGLPSAFVPLDFNGDKKPDVAVTVSGAGPTDPGSILLLQGDGTGHFSLGKQSEVEPSSLSESGIAPSFLAVGSSPSDIVTADFNGDGNADLAVANAGSGNVTVFLGDGKGGFSPAGTFPAGSNPSALAVGDLNGDGKADLVVANKGEDTVTVLIGDGTGNFTQPSTNISAGSGPASLAIADFNGDGALDIAVADSGSNTVTLLLGDGTGAMVSDAVFQVGSAPSSVVAADFDGDGKPDLAVASLDGTIAILLSSSASVARPVITQATKAGKNLLVTGTGFDSGATILVDGAPQHTIADSQNPTTSLIGRKAGKHVSAGSVVQVQNSTGILSQWLIFGR